VLVPVEAFTAIPTKPVAVPVGTAVLVSIFPAFVTI